MASLWLGTEMRVHQGKGLAKTNELNGLYGLVNADILSAMYGQRHFTGTLISVTTSALACTHHKNCVVSSLRIFTFCTDKCKYRDCHGLYLVATALIILLFIGHYGPRSSSLFVFGYN